jgi:hypothetical protein
LGENLAKERRERHRLVGHELAQREGTIREQHPGNSSIEATRTRASSARRKKPAGEAMRCLRPRRW